MSATPKIRIDLNSSIPAYRQIVDALRVLFVEGRILPGDSLPSVRRIALDLGVHFNTVGEAYRQLALEGWIDLQQGKSAVVRDRGVPPPAPVEQVKQFRSRLRAFVAEARSSGIASARIAEELKSLAQELLP